MSTTAAGAVTAADGTGAMAAAGAAPRSSTFDFRTAVLTAALTLVAFAIAVATPPLSGPFCVAGCVTYPYTDFASRVPRDFLWMWPALLVTPAFAVLAGSVLERAPAERRRHGRLGFGFALVATGLLTAVYLVQLRFVQPAILLGETAGLEPWSQYNPHGVFIALEEAGYLLIALAFPFLALALPRTSALERAARRVLMTGAGAMLAFLVGLSIRFGMAVEYRFEVAAITVDWTVIIVVGVLLALRWRV